MALPPLKIGARVEIDPSKAQQGAAAASKAISGIGDAANKTAADLQRLIATSTGLHDSSAFRDRGADVAAYGAELDRLRARFNPLFSVISKYKAIQGEIRQAHSVGAISADEMSAAFSRERQAALAAIDAIKGRNRALLDTPATSNRGAGAQNFNTANLAFQFQDVFATAAFMPWYTVALQQGPQVAAVMDSLENKSAALKGAFMSLISPWSLISIAAIGATAGVIQYLTSASDGAKSLDDILAKHKANIDLLGPAYAKAAEERRKFTAVDESIVNAGLSDSAKAARDKLLKDARSSFSEIQRELALEQGMFGNGDLGATFLTSRYQGARKAIAEFGAAIAANRPEVEAFQKEITRLEKAGDIPAKAAQTLRDITNQLLKDAQTVAATAEQIDPVTLAYSRLQIAIDDINPGNASGRLGKVDEDLNNLFRNMKSGETTVRGLNLTLDKLSNANPDLSKAIEEIRRLTLEAQKAAGAVQMINGQAFDNAGSIRKGGRNEIRPGTDADLDFFLRTDKDLPEKLKSQYEEQERAANKADRAGKSAANAYRDLIKSADDRIGQMKLEAQLAGQTGVAADALRFKLDLLQQSEDKGRSLTPKQVEAINQRVEAFKKYAEEAAKAQLASDLLFEREQLGRSAMDQQIAAQLKGAGLPVDFDSYEAGLIRTNLQLQYARELTGDFVGTLADGIQQGKGLWESLGDAAVSVLKRISDTLLNDVLNSLFQVNGAAAGGSSGGGLLGSLLGGLGSLFGGSSAFPSRPGGLYRKGAAFEDGISAYSNQIVSKPTFFAFAKGTGLMGEEGPEAIMPLTRDASGRLGVTATVAPLMSSRMAERQSAAAADRGMGTLKLLLGLSADENGNIMPTIRKAIADNVPEYVQLAFDDYDQGLPDRVAAIQSEPWRR
ncbi:phage tail length tape measure family protein [Neorhizobium petrolearium]|uniref:phage tail length tape measure family protein n=1 Tax=Neorhizobium petrolearium TaxID=515361 RepID=UPI003F7E6C5D